MNAAVNPDGSPTTVFFEWGADTNYGNIAAAVILSTNLTSSNAVTFPLFGLMPNSTIHFQAMAINSFGTGYGGDATFTVTSGSPPPTVPTFDAVTGAGSLVEVGTITGTNCITTNSSSVWITDITATDHQWRGRPDLYHRWRFKWTV